MRVLSLIEARVVTSPARIILNFAGDCRPQVDLTIATFVRPPAGERHPLMETARAEGIPVRAIPEAGRFDFSALTNLKQMIAELQPDLVQTNSIKSHLLVSLLRERPFGWLAFHHGYTAEDVKMRLYNQLDRWSLRACDGVVTVCEAFARDLEKMGVARRRITVIPNGIRPDFIVRDEATAAAVRARYGLAPGDLLVLSAGRLSPEKGHRFLIEAAGQLPAHGPAPKYKVLIAGDGLLTGALGEQIRAAGLEQRVELIGHQADVRPLFAAADVFVLPSLSEGSPMVLLESMAAGVPVLATRVGGIPEAVTDNETALLSPPADGVALSRALLRLLNEPALRARLATNAQERVRTCYSPELYNRRVLAALGGRASARAGLQSCLQHDRNNRNGRDQA